MGFFRTPIIALMFLGMAIAAQAPTPFQQADGTTPLHLAVRSDDIAAVRRLLRAGANAGARNRYGVTPLSLAAANGNATIVDALLKAGADSKAMLPGDQTILMVASRSRSEEHP